MMFFVYIARTADDALYIGVTEDVEQRLRTHNRGNGANWIKVHHGARVVYLEPHLPVGSARKREVQLKKWSRAKKEALIAGDLSALKKLSRSRASARMTDQPSID